MSGTLDLASVRELRRTWHPDKGLSWVEVEYQGNETYTVSGWSDGTKAVCCDECWGWRRWQKCKHQAAFPLMLDELAQQTQAKKPTPLLRADLARWLTLPTLTSDERRVLNAIRAVLRARGVRATEAERGAAVARGRMAAEELAG